MLQKYSHKGPSVTIQFIDMLEKTEYIAKQSKATFSLKIFYVSTICDGNQNKYLFIDAGTLIPCFLFPMSHKSSSG